MMIWEEDCGYCTSGECCNAYGKDKSGRSGFTVTEDHCAIQCCSCHTRFVVCECCGALTDDDFVEEEHGIFCRMCGFLNVMGDTRCQLSRNLLSFQPIDDSVLVC